LGEETELVVGYVIEEGGSVRAEALASAVKGCTETRGGGPKCFLVVVGAVGIGVFTVEFEGVINRRAKVTLLRRPPQGHLKSEVARVSGHYEATVAVFSRSGHLFAAFVGLEFQLPMHGLGAVGITLGGGGELGVTGDEGLGQGWVEMAKDVKDLEQDVLAAGGDMDVRVTS
jgi:hypothetical protein